MAKHYQSFKLLEFNVMDIENESSDSDDNDNSNKKNNNKYFRIQLFGLNTKGETCSIFINDFKPFFYIKVSDNWTNGNKLEFVDYLKSKLGSYYDNCILDSKLIKRKKLYGFDDNKFYKFILLKLKNMQTFYKVKRLWYNNDRLKPFIYNNEELKLYEANIPPLLRLFHIKNISPSGWISISSKYISLEKLTNCKYEYNASYKNIITLSTKETSVPYKVASYDIEASSSHGDFPVPEKTYKKLATNIVDGIIKNNIMTDDINCYVSSAIKTAFGFEYNLNIDKVYPKKTVTLHDLNNYIKVIQQFNNYNINNYDNIKTIESLFDNIENEDDIVYKTKSSKNSKFNNLNILLDNKDVSYSNKIEEFNKLLTNNLPPLEGDKITFIGTTFTKHGDHEAYLNHCIVLGSCDQIPTENTQIDCYDTEKDVLLAWTKLIQKHDPDIIMGYNIFGFDYQFMFRRAKELGCLYEFLLLSRNNGELCAKLNYHNKNLELEQSSIVLASGQHDLHYIKMNGRLQIDLYNYFRKGFNLEQYKLDYVSSYFIGDKIKNITKQNNRFYIYTNNIAGLKINDYINFELIGHTNDKYNNGDKFQVLDFIDDNKGFITNGDLDKLIEHTKDKKWCLTKDDVSPQDIFKLSNEGPKERAIVAKYCIQDCNLVYELFKKIDIMTEFIEMAKLCSVPINFLVYRGQGIKLTSFISKKCREDDTLMPVINKCITDEGFEGATVLEPKCNIYLEDPVACVDFGSLYPSSMISENLCHSTKVWTKEFDLQDNLIKITGTDIYDDNSQFKFVDVTYDTFTYIRKTPKGAFIKVKTGYKICRYEQTIKGILPRVLEELLKARSDTKKLKAKETNVFMKNILDKRQLTIKLTANSLYGQTGAKTSTFYEPDVAASTTATGRKLLLYAKSLIENEYGNNIHETKNYGQVKTNAKYIYGDTDSVFFCFYLEDIDGIPIKGKKALEITIELGLKVEESASKTLKNPHKLEYEKTFLPYILLSKKRYVGILYEFDPDKGKCKSMGIVLKRRDNAPIVKDIYGGIIDIIMNEKDISAAIKFLEQSLHKLINKQCDVNKLIITKSLRSNYKNPNQIAHKVLADRIALRDPGNKLKSGDRVAYVYITNNNKKALQGERIETLSYINENKLSIDYGHYITNQIMKPVQQVFALILDQIPYYNIKAGRKRRFEQELKKHKLELSDEKYKIKEEQLKNKMVKTLLFDKYLHKITMKEKAQLSITDFYK